MIFAVKKINATFLNVWLSIFFNNVYYFCEMRLIHFNGKTKFLRRKPRVISNETLFVDLPLFTTYFEVLIFLIWKFRVLKFNAWNSHFKFMLLSLQIYGILDAGMPGFWSYAAENMCCAKVSGLLKKEVVKFIHGYSYKCWPLYYLKSNCLC